MLVREIHAQNFQKAVGYHLEAGFDIEKEELGPLSGVFGPGQVQDRVFV